MTKVNTQDYGKLLINGAKNDAATYCPQIVEGLEHERVVCYLHGAKLSSKVI